MFLLVLYLEPVVQQVFCAASPACLESSLNVELQMFRTKLWFWAPCKTNKPLSESLAVSKASQQPGCWGALLDIKSFMPWLGLCVLHLFGKFSSCQPGVLQDSPLSDPERTLELLLVFPEPVLSHRAATSGTPVATVGGAESSWPKCLRIPITGSWILNLKENNRKNSCRIS